MSLGSIRLVCLLLLTCLLPTSLQAATYYWQRDAGTAVSGFTTDSPACGEEDRNLFVTTIMSAGGFNCNHYRQDNRLSPPQDMMLLIKDIAYAVETPVSGVDIQIAFEDDGSGGVTARYELGYAFGGVFTSWGFVDEGPHVPLQLRTTDLSSITGVAPAGSHLAFRVSSITSSPGRIMMYWGSDENSGILNVTETVPPLNIVKRAFWPDGMPIPTGSIIPSGVEFRYLLYINNTSVVRNDVSVRDVLDPVFEYQANTIRVDNSLAECAAAVCLAAEELAIFSAVNGTAPLSDAIDGDGASYTSASSSIDAGAGNVANLQLDINANAVWTISFSARMP